MSVQLKDILSAENRIEKYIRETPFVYSPVISEEKEAQIYLKLESCQATGSFKLRGATNKILQLTNEEKARGIITASAGNHAQGVAFIANKLGIDTVIVIPESAPMTKIENTRRYGVQVVVRGTDYDDSERIAHELEKESGRIYIHAFDDPMIIAGQGTVGLEMLQEISDLDMVLVPVGGGGLMTGVASAIKGVNPNISVVGIQPAVSKPWYEAFHQKKYVKESFGDSWADGLTGDISPAMINDFNAVVDEMLLVDEESIQQAIYYFIDKHHQIVEGSGAVGIAALLSDKLDIKGKKVGIVVTGSNFDTHRVKSIVNKYMEEA